MRARVEVEVEWLIYLSAHAEIGEVLSFAAADEKFLRDVVADFSLDDAAEIKTIEQTTNHDVKAVEYFLKTKIAAHKNFAQVGDQVIAQVIEWIHFACTSEDINNLAHALMLKRARDEVVLPAMQSLIDALSAAADRHADLPMLARTHGQPASPTTLGKEFAVFARRLDIACSDFAAQKIYGKFNGASGNFNAHFAAYPNIDWQAVAADFVGKFDLTYQALTTQIEPHDYLAAVCHALIRFNTICIDLSRDIWGYIALGYFHQATQADDVGSSAMPHKINPIDFENAEGNLGIANALLMHFAAKLPISRWQRDLSDSTVLRAFGTAVGHSLLAITAAMRGLAKLTPNPAQLTHDLDANWEVLAEAIQTVMRRYGIDKPYEQLKSLTRGGHIDPKNLHDTLHDFIAKLQIPDDAKKRLLALTPSTYLGHAPQLARRIKNA